MWSSDLDPVCFIISVRVTTQPPNSLASLQRGELLRKNDSQVCYPYNYEVNVMVNVVAMFIVACIVRRITIGWIKGMAKSGSRKKKVIYRLLLLLRKRKVGGTQGI